MSNSENLMNDLLQLARVALAGRQQDIQLIIHRLSKKYKKTFPNAAVELVSLLQEAPTRSSPLRKHMDVPLPVDVDSRLHLLKIENTPLEHEPVLSEKIEQALKQIISERDKTHSLLTSGLQPTKSILFTGPPGVGKTMAAKWLALKLNRPLLILDLAAVMSSFLGRTGNNVRHVLDYAKGIDCVLLIDELDAIAKRRDDVAEVGELKRLVTVLLQEIDDWPPTGLLLAATNHPDLLDPAVWRRFELILNFEKPNVDEIVKLTDMLISPYLKDHKKWSGILSYLFKGKSFSEIEREINLARRTSVLAEKPLGEVLQEYLTINNYLTRKEKIEFARTLNQSNILSQREVQKLTGVARETMRKSNT